MVAVDMGYGHHRAADALKHLAPDNKVIIANNYPGITERDRKIWRESRELYEFLSRFKPVPLIGDLIFGILEKFQQIPEFYPRRDLTKPVWQLTEIYGYITKKGFGKDLIDQLAKNPLPLICTFPVPAFAAEYFDYPNDIYCVICDTDMSRFWVSPDPKRSRIKYLAPNGRVVERLKLYGVLEENIFLTGFPLPPENIGGVDYKTIRHDLGSRIYNLDPNKIFVRRHESTLKDNLGKDFLPKKADHPLTLTFSVGGAGAQRALAIDVLKSLRVKIKKHQIKYVMVAGTRKNLAMDFRQAIADLGLYNEIGKYVEVLYYPKRDDYFREFNRVLRQTDLLWTKPSELSFYCGLGIPVLMAPPIGSQEQFNRVWLRAVGGGISQNDPRYCDEWIFDWVNSGGLAKVAWSGFIEAPTHGAYRIEQIVLKHKYSLEEVPLIV